MELYLLLGASCRGKISQRGIFELRLNLTHNMRNEANFSRKNPIRTICMIIMGP